MKCYLCILLLFITSVAFCQNEQINQESSHHEQEGKHKIALYTGTSWVPEGRNPITGEKETILAPTWGFAYEYWLHEKWAVGTYCDVEFVNAIVERDGGEQVRRQNVRVITFGTTYEILPRWTAYFGVGGETDEHQSIFVGRLTTEYALVEHKGWEGELSLSYLAKDFYNVFSLGFVLAKRF